MSIKPHHTPYLKVCGMADADSLQAVAALQPDFLGFIFYPQSKRYVGGRLPAAAVRALPAAIRRVGVFVDEQPAAVLDNVQEYGLDVVQLHGQESADVCLALRMTGVAVIKAFAVGEEFDFTRLEPYVGCVDYFLFDAAGAQPGGNGTAFRWELLQGYTLPVPYFLAGGIGPEHAVALPGLSLPGLFALDLNSRFETAPGVKDAGQLGRFFRALNPKNQESYTDGL
ncbi:phosphoribosylanthranilate isomerase [Hymenobacter metallilatus]|uniref:N-(5'-phosphoribosyl)anthranilate isomerase n=1 Tax=Hymenobacter metallilatus TaxID=2493666 RepID=A0A428JC97_9BACT|nr:phosphoribosylanthranilate isomerase [Hymenobacter metallilatus]RSK29543.1 phosphoribosylanthranilate isomerase [Hymenobacter metallilatus]